VVADVILDRRPESGVGQGATDSSSRPIPDSDVEIVREALFKVEPPLSGDIPARAALARLEARLAEVEQENRLLKALDEIEPVVELRARAEMAEARVEAVEAQALDLARLSEEQLARALAAERERDAYKKDRDDLALAALATRAR